jgi:hypothetical protein
MDLAEPELEANNVCSSKWAGETNSQIFNPDDFRSVDDGLASCVSCDFHAELGCSSEEEMTVNRLCGSASEPTEPD